MAGDDIFVAQPFRLNGGALEPREPVATTCEAEMYRRGVAMADRMDGLVFYRIDCSASGDQWTEVELLTTTGKVPAEAA